LTSSELTLSELTLSETARGRRCCADALNSRSWYCADPKDETCPLSTGGRTRRVHLVREGVVRPTLSLNDTKLARRDDAPWGCWSSERAEVTDALRGDL